MSKHTPGPWTKWVSHPEVYANVGKNMPGQLVGKYKKKPMPRIAACEDMDIDDDEADANAALIAAAPEMLDMLKRLLDHPGFVKPFEKSTTMTVMRALVAKAEGRHA